MASITPRKNKDGSMSYKAQVRVRRDGKIVHQETKTFDRKQAAATWAKKRESDLTTAEGLRAALQEDPPLKEIIKKYKEERQKPLDRTKVSILDQLAESDIGSINGRDLTSANIVAIVKQLNIAPSTRGHYLSHLSSVLKVARPLWGYPVDAGPVSDARIALVDMGLVGRSRHRERRPTLDELDRLMRLFGSIREGAPSSIPMQAIAAFTIFSMRRISEICRIEWDDFDPDEGRVMVRDLKHPNTKAGNDTWVDLTPEAVRIIEAQPRTDKRIFPYRALTASTAFGNATSFLEIDDLTLNDLRHEGCSRLAEMSWTVQRIAAVTGHRSWNTLKRYTQFRKLGDKFAGWPWLDVIAPPKVATTT
jgi:integrase